jgi:hypothetical protein
MLQPHKITVIEKRIFFCQLKILFCNKNIMPIVQLVVKVEAPKTIVVLKTMVYKMVSYQQLNIGVKWSVFYCHDLMSPKT